jgi:hypothetical protein
MTSLTTTLAVPTSEQSAGWAGWVTLATLRATCGLVDTAAPLADVRAALVGLVGEAPVGANTVAAGAFYARKDGWMSSPKRGQHAVTIKGVDALRGFGFPISGEEAPADVAVAEPVVATPEVEVAKVAEIIAFPEPVASAGVVWTPPTVAHDPYAGVDDYVVGLAAAATPCFGGYSARAKATCGACPLAARCAASATTRMTEIAAMIEREEIEAIARKEREEREAILRKEREEAEAIREADARRKAEEAEAIRARAEEAARMVADVIPTTATTASVSSPSLASLLQGMAPAAPAAPSNGTVMSVAFDAVCAKCRGTIPRDSSAVYVPGSGLFHTACV